MRKSNKIKIKKQPYFVSKKNLLIKVCVVVNNNF